MRASLIRLMPTKFEVKTNPYRFMPKGHAIQSWIVPIGVWAVGAGTFVSMLLSPVPLFQHDVLFKIPGLKAFYEDNTPASDKPF